MTDRDVRREDPFEMSFKLLFNDPAFEPEASESALDMKQSALDEMAVAAADRPNERKAEVLKNRWRSIRTGFTQCVAQVFAVRRTKSGHVSRLPSS
jgi:hypothetical protein